MEKYQKNKGQDKVEGQKTSSPDSAQEAETTKYAQEPENTKYAQEPETTKYAQEPETTKYAQEPETTKYAQEPETTKYAQEPEHTVYAQAGRNGNGDYLAKNKGNALIHRRAVDGAIEEALMSIAASIDRIHPGVSNEARANLTCAVVEKFGQVLLNAHLHAIASLND